MSRRMIVLAAALAVSSASAAEKGTPLYVTGDVGLTSVVGKKTFGNGRGPTTPLMQNQNWSGFENKTLLMAFDTRKVAGWSIEKAVMHIYLAKGDLYGIGLCTVLGDWTEGGALNWVRREGCPSWDFARTPAPGADIPPDYYWAFPGSRFHSVCFSHPAARYSHAGPRQIRREKTADGRFLHLSFPVDGKLVESLAADLATGLVLTDDKGQVRESYSLIGAARPYRYNAAEDAWMFTKDVQDGHLRPWLEVWGAPTDKVPPAALKNLKVAETGSGFGGVVLTFTAPGDDGAKGDVLGYEAAEADERLTDENFSRAARLARWAMPPPTAAGKTQRMPLFTRRTGTFHVGIRAVDEAGHRGPVADVRVTVPAPPPAALAEVKPAAKEKLQAWTAVAEKLTIAACPDTVKVDPVTGGVLADGEQYRLVDPVVPGSVWNPATKTVRLTAAANEVAAFQLILGRGKNRLTRVRVSVGDLAGPGGRTIAAAPNVELFRLWYVSPDPKAARAAAVRSRTTGSTWHGDACLPLKAPFPETFDLPAADNAVAGQRFQSVWADLYVPRGTPAGGYKGRIVVTAKELGGAAALNLHLEVLPLSLPDELTWKLELNRYHSIGGWAGARGADAARNATWDYHRLAHRHRSVLIVLPYSHSGRVDREYVPVMEGEGASRRIKDWTDYDRLMDPLLDGAAFTAAAGYVGPGEGMPLDHMYTPFHEAWPMPVNKDTYADWMAVGTRIEFAEYAKKARRPHLTFSEAYKKGFVAVARQFFEHFQQRGWTRTTCHLYNNNKYYWKVAYFGGMGRGGVSFWLMDEPADFDDYDANAFVMSLGLAGYAAAKAPDVRVAGRTDVSQVSMTRGLWDGVATVWCIGGFRGFAPTGQARRRWLPDEQHWGYGGGCGATDAPVRMSAACLKRWAAGYDGWMPWWNCFGGGGGAWQRATNLAVYYTGRNYAGSGKTYPGPIAGVRLKLTRRCQQDVEYLHLLAACKGWDRDRVRRAVAAWADDGRELVLTFEKLTAARMNQLRRRVVATILAERK